MRFSKCSFLIATVLVGALTGCGGSSTSAPTTPVVADVVVSAVSGLRFNQTSYTAASGDVSFAYVNADTIRHTLVVVQDGTKVAGFELKVSQKGDLDSGTVNLTPGTYELLCTVPGHQSMKASFTVK